MLRILLILSAFIFLFCPGCASSGSGEQASIEGIKLSDLRESQSYNQADEKRVSLTNIGFYVFEMPASKLDSLDEVFGELNSDVLTISNEKSFSSNGFRAGLGRGKSWDRAADILRESGAQKIRELSLMFFGKNSELIFLSGFEDEQSVFYESVTGQLAGRSFPAGKTYFQILCEDIALSRGGRKISIRPGWSSEEYAAMKDEGSSPEIVFDGVSFGFVASGGDFLFIGPSNYKSSQIGLSELFFSGKSPDSVFLYLLVCRGTSD